MSKWEGDTPGLIDRFSAARWLGISVRKLDDLVRQKLIPSVKLGGRRLFDLEQLRRYVHRMHEESGVS